MHRWSSQTELGERNQRQECWRRNLLLHPVSELFKVQKQKREEREACFLIDSLIELGSDSATRLFGTMIGDEVLNTQCMDVAKCLNGLGLKLTQADGTPADISKILYEVHKLIKSFKVLGKYYAVELLKKCRELETKNREVEVLSRKLQQFQGDGKIGHSIAKQDCQLDGQKRQRMEMETRVDPQAKSISERQGDVFEGAERNDFQCLKTKSAEVERSGEDSAFRTGTPIQHETAKGKERMECPGVANRPRSRVQFTDKKHFEELSWPESDSRGFFTFKNSSSHSEFDDERTNIDQGTRPYTKNTFHYPPQNSAGIQIQSLPLSMAEEQSSADNLCRLMKAYQDVFLEKAPRADELRADDFKKISHSSAQILQEYQRKVEYQHQQNTHQ